ncbi:hypothetical protein ACFQY4_23300 [Catellatospora bangladeshensis]|uniref:Uncharacterized protein n=1 Tax=Catellatospora bangladeshensis TaxID=310355 RepID=A0A8J3JGK6_9ACTN|nr:hypothetical protein [Catellatospora bangladeshensis]GIF80281.1 hypothetical protein Cba03nite_16300 [Catellatospora bangladeshensis]
MPTPRLPHVYWIGGASGAAKSTVARRLAERHGLRLYATDDVMTEHAARSTSDDSPLLAAFAAMDLDERWLLRSPQVMLDTFHWYRGEGFDHIVHDLATTPTSPPVVAEGFRLLPHLVEPLLADRTHAVWLLPTPDFRRTAFDTRGSTWKIAGRTSDPERALRNLFERERLFTDRLRGEVARLNLPAVEVDGAMSEDELVDRVATLFGL